MLPLFVLVTRHIASAAFLDKKHAPFPEIHRTVFLTGHETLNGNPCLVRKSTALILSWLSFVAWSIEQSWSVQSNRIFRHCIKIEKFNTHPVRRATISSRILLHDPVLGDYGRATECSNVFYFLERVVAEGPGYKENASDKKKHLFQRTILSCAGRHWIPRLQIERVWQKEAHAPMYLTSLSMQRKFFCKKSSRQFLVKYPIQFSGKDSFQLSVNFVS